MPLGLICALLGCGTREAQRKAEPNAPQQVAAQEGSRDEEPTVDRDESSGRRTRSAKNQDAGSGGAQGEGPGADFDPDTTTSVGGPSGGRLEGGVALPDKAPGFRMNPKRPNPEGRFATAELANALLSAAAKVAAKFPGSELVVGDLSLEEGGPIYHHGSHQSGRDVDVLFYYRTTDGKFFESKGIPIEPDGTGDDFGDLTDPNDDVSVKLDLPRTWAFVEAFVTQPDVRIARIFVVEHVREMLLEYARKSGAAPEAIEAFARTTCQPAVPHDDHFHIRLFCSAQDIKGGCQDAHPIYPWQRAYLAEHELEPSIAVRTRKQKKDTKKRTVSQEQAADKAGPLHEDVRAFLERRKAWSKVPHPGRPYCK